MPIPHLLIMMKPQGHQQSDADDPRSPHIGGEIRIHAEADADDDGLPQPQLFSIGNGCHSQYAEDEACENIVGIEIQHFPNDTESTCRSDLLYFLP